MFALELECQLYLKKVNVFKEYLYYNTSKTEYTGAIPVYDAFSGRGVGPVHMTSVGCHGNEDNLTECSYISGIGVDSCYHGKDVGVICLGKE